MTRNLHTEILSDPAALARAVAEWMTRLALGGASPFSVALSGGSTPSALYSLLASDAYRSRFPWQRVHWFWGDERFVPHDSPRSNFRLARDSLLSHAPVPSENIHPVPVENLSPPEAALAYERTLKIFHGTGSVSAAKPLFDIVFLGLGEDGHCASLFPGSPALDEKEHWTLAVIGPEKGPRITLTYPALQSCRHAAFLVSGVSKAPALRRFLASDRSIPAGRFQPEGALLLFADSAAMGGI